MVTRWGELKTEGSSSFGGGRLAACKPFRVSRLRGMEFAKTRGNA